MILFVDPGERFKEMVMARPPHGISTDILAAVCVMAGCLFSGTVMGQTAPSAVRIRPGTPVTPAAPAAPVTPAVTPSLPSEVPAVTQPFVGTVTADKVYVRSGPGSAWYELGHLAKGDTVQVVGTRSGWFEIFPPNGTFCMIAKDMVDVDGTEGTVKVDYVNLRAGTALNKARDPSAVLCVVRKGQKLTILGSTDKYYEVAPTERAYVYISPNFVSPAPAGTEYKIPTLRLPAGVTGPAKDTVTVVGAVPTEAERSPAAAAGGGSTSVTPPGNFPPAGGESTMIRPPGGEGAAAQTQPAQSVQAPLPAPQPTAAFSKDAYNKFNELNGRYQAELQKPVGTRDLAGMIAEYKALIAEKEGVPPSVRQGSESRIAALEKLQTIQRLQKESVASADALAAQRKALQEQYSAAEKAIEDYEKTGPYLAEGTLQTSTAVTGKYALVNPVTGRTVAYVDPASQIDIGSLLGKYIGVRGVTKKAEGTEVNMIEVKNATLLPAPVVARPSK